MLKTKNYNLLELLPLDINNKKTTRERLVEINIDEDRKMGIASITNIGTQLFSGISRDKCGVILYTWLLSLTHCRW